MPRKYRQVRTALEGKSFSVEESRKHVHFVYEDIDGLTTTARTMLSHASGGADVSDTLLALMVRQVGLRRAQFLDLVDCPMSREQLDALIRRSQGKGA